MSTTVLECAPLVNPSGKSKKNLPMHGIAYFDLNLKVTLTSGETSNGNLV
jgi:hypothetical protein